MFPFADASGLSASQITVVTEAMLLVAGVDEAGSAEEVALIRSFYEGATGQGPRSDFRELLSAARGGLSLSAEMFTDDSQKDLTIGLCLMVAYADGSFSPKEQAAVLGLSQQIGMERARYDGLVEQVRDHLLQQLATLPDAASVVKVAREL